MTCNMHESDERDKENLINIIQFQVNDGYFLSFLPSSLMPKIPRSLVRIRFEGSFGYFKISYWSYVYP